MRKRLLIGLVLALGVTLVPALPAQTAFPGGNGRVVYSRFQRGNYDLFTVNRFGGNRTRLTGTRKFEIDPSFSPNGLFILFTRTDGGDFEIFKMMWDGSNVVQLTDNRANDFDASWSPNGERIVFVRQPRQGNSELAAPGDLFKMDADGSDAERIRRTDATEIAPVWSPDGRRIAFCRGPIDGNLSIHTIKPNGTDAVRLTGRSSYNCHPNWSPTGRKLTFYSDRDGDGEIMTMSRAGNNLVNVTSNTKEDSTPVWSPDREWILYVRFAGGDFGLRRIRPNTADDQRFVDGNKDEQFPDWSSR